MAHCNGKGPWEVSLLKAHAFSLLIINPTNFICSTSKCSSYPHWPRVHHNPQGCLGNGGPVLFIPVHQTITVHTGNWNRTWKLELEKSTGYGGWLPHGGIFRITGPTDVFFFMERQWGTVARNSHSTWIPESYDLVLPVTLSYLTVYKIVIITRWNEILSIACPAQRLAPSRFL